MDSITSLSTSKNGETIFFEFSSQLFRCDTEEEAAILLAVTVSAYLDAIKCTVYNLDPATNFPTKIAQHVSNRSNPSASETNLDRKLITSILNDTRSNRTKTFLTNGVLPIPILDNSQVIGGILCEPLIKKLFPKQDVKIVEKLTLLYVSKIKNIKSTLLKLAKEKERLIIDNQMLALRSAALSIHMSPHFVFNVLNAIQYFITNNNHKKALKNLAVFSRLIRYYLTNFQNQDVSLHEEVKMLKWYLQLQQLRYEDRFDYVLNCEGLSQFNNHKIPSMIIPVLLEEIIESSVSDVEHKVVLKLHIGIANKLIHFSVEYPKTHQVLSKIGRDTTTKGWQSQINLIAQTRNYHVQSTSKKTDENIKVCLKFPIFD